MSVTHPFAPVWDAASRLLILGSFPSVKSRETGFYYGHKQNRFWKVLAGVFEDAVPDGIEQKTAFLLRHSVAVWDVAQRCEITGSADSSLKQAVPNDIGWLLQQAPIGAVFANGHTAGRLYERLVQPRCGKAAVVLPSTSPANAAYSLERLIKEWEILRDFQQKTG